MLCLLACGCVRASHASTVLDRTACRVTFHTTVLRVWAQCLPLAYQLLTGGDDSHQAVVKKKQPEAPPRWYVTESELNGLSSYMRGRLTLDKVGLESGPFDDILTHRCRLGAGTDVKQLHRCYVASSAACLRFECGLACCSALHGLKDCSHAAQHLRAHRISLFVLCPFIACALPRSMQWWTSLQALLRPTTSS